MSEDLYVWIPRWGDFQHYKPNPDRGPAWIKTHTAQLQDGRYLRLNDRQRALMHDLRMLFAMFRARLPYDRRMIGKLRGAETRHETLESLIHAGLLEVISRATLEQRLEQFYSRSRAEVEEEKEKEQPSVSPSTSTYTRNGRTENDDIDFNLPPLAGLLKDMPE